MPRIAEADRLEFAARARSLFISGATVEWFLVLASGDISRSTVGLN